MVKEFNFKTGNPIDLTAGQLAEKTGGLAYKDKRKSGYIRFKVQFGNPAWARRKDEKVGPYYLNATVFLSNFCKKNNLVLEEDAERGRLIFRVPYL